MSRMNHVEAENWDDDFDVADDIQFRQSVSSSAYFDEEDQPSDHLEEDLDLSESAFEYPSSDFVTSTQKRLPSKIYSSSVQNLQAFQEPEWSAAEFGDGFGTINVKNMAANRLQMYKSTDPETENQASSAAHVTESRLRKQASMRLISTAKKQGIPLPAHLVRNATSPRKVSQLQKSQNHNNNGYYDGYTESRDTSDIYGTIRPKSNPISNKPLNSGKNHKNVFDDETEDFDDGFDFRGTNHPLTLQNLALQNLTLQDKGSTGGTMSEMSDEDAFSMPDFKAGSRRSTMSVSTTATTATATSGSAATNYDESGDDNDLFETDFDFKDDGEALQGHLGLRERLELRQKKAAEEAALENSRLARRLHGTVKSMSKDQSVSFAEPEYEGNDLSDEEDIMDGLDLTDFDFDRNLTVKGSIHRNAFIGPRGARHQGQGILPRYRLVPSTSTVNLRTPRHMASSINMMNTNNTNSASFQRTGSNHNHNNTQDAAQNTLRARGLRPVQSLVTLRQTSASASHKPTPTSFQKTNGPQLRRMRSNIFGDGTELDKLEDLPEVPSGDNTLRGLPSTLLDKYREKPTRPSKHKHSNIKAGRKRDSKTQSKAQSRSHHGHSHSHNNTLQSDVKRKPHVPMLIQRLGGTVQATGDMRYNPHKQIWEGNDLDAKKFDSVTAKTPGLIAYKSNNNLQVSGDMYFDPQNLCWLKKSDAADDDDEDPFAGLEDLDEAKDPLAMSKQSFSSSVYGSRQHSQNHHQQVQFQQSQGLGGGLSQVRGMKVSQSMGNIGRIASMGDEFMLSKEFIARLEHEDQRWSRKYSAWVPSDETPSRDYLDELRQMVMG